MTDFNKKQTAVFENSFATKKEAMAQATVVGIDKRVTAIRTEIDGDAVWVFELKPVVEKGPSKASIKAAEVAKRKAENEAALAEAMKADAPEGVTPDEPVKFVWAFLAANDQIERKHAVRVMIDKFGLNENMTKTQAARYYKTGGDKDAWAALEKAKREAEKAELDALRAAAANSDDVPDAEPVGDVA